ncbi:MAG TPA: recombinase family protein [Symbiobacteriaceae bacterium]|jgi:site-specific DNA recombinase
MVQVQPDKVAIYIRWSTEDQGLGHTLEIQRESCRYYCLAQGWTPREAATFIDDGYSGSTLERPALARLRALVQAGDVECVVVYKLDRLSRNVRDMLNLVLDEWEERCFVRSTQEPVDTTSDAGRMFFAMLGSFADFERSSIKSRTWSGKRKNAEQGKNPGMVYPYGFVRSETGGWELVEPEAALVRRIFETYIRGGSCRRIAATLNQEGLRTRSGKRWADADISRLLRNPLYAGRLVYNRRAFARRAKVGHVALKDPADVITCEGAAPAVVDAETWAAAARIRAERPRVDRPGGARAVSSPHLLAGLLKCAQCGHTWVCLTGGKRRERFYACGGARSGGPAVCASRSVKAETLEQFVLCRARESWTLPAALRPDLLTRTAGRARDLEDRFKALRHRLSGLEAALARFKADYKAGKLPAEAYSDLLAENRTEQAELRSLLAALETERQAAPPDRPDLDLACRLYARMDPWDTLLPPERQQVLRLLLTEIRVCRPKTGGDLTLHLNWRLPATV